MKQIIVLVLSAVLLTSCYRKPDVPKGTFAKGADLSWLSEMEGDGVKFYEPGQTHGSDLCQSSDCIEFLRGMGMNAVRLRVWVNHSTGWSNKADMLTLAKRAAQQGQRIMIDFHYSDFFADPSHQTIPTAWQDYSYEQLCECVREHTLDILYALKEAGIKPEWVQIGNETPNGMLWPVGKLNGERTNGDEWNRYAGLTTMGYKAAKEAFSDVTVIVHVDNAYEYRGWFWDGLKEHGGRFDMIGLSHYPMMTAWSGISWQEANRRAEENIRHLIAEYKVPVMVCEIGMANWGEGAAYDSIAALADKVMGDFTTRVTAIDSCAGIFYWEPECYGGWRPAEYIPLDWGGYDMGSFTPDGQPSPALKTLMSL